MGGPGRAPPGPLLSDAGSQPLAPRGGVTLQPGAHGPRPLLGTAEGFRLHWPLVGHNRGAHFPTPWLSLGPGGEGLLHWSEGRCQSPTTPGEARLPSRGRAALWSVLSKARTHLASGIPLGP